MEKLIDKVFNQHCTTTLKKKNLSYDYVLTTYPEYDELGLKPKRDDKKYFALMRELPALLNPKKHFVTFIQTDRKYQGIIQRHVALTTAFEENGYKLHSQKIWVKSEKADLYRLTYAFILTFSREGYKQNNIKGFKPDVFIAKPEEYGGYRNSFPVEIAKLCIENHTKKRNIVYDPFFGVGTTGVAAIETGRHYVGSETNKENCVKARKRIKISVADKKKPKGGTLGKMPETSGDLYGSNKAKKSKATKSKKKVPQKG
jgi:DNA modification methylase